MTSRRDKGDERMNMHDQTRRLVRKWVEDTGSPVISDGEQSKLRLNIFSLIIQMPEELRRD